MPLADATIRDAISVLLKNKADLAQALAGDPTLIDQWRAARNAGNPA